MTTVLVIRWGAGRDAGCLWGRVLRPRGMTTRASRAGSVQDDEGLRTGRTDLLSGVPDAVFHLDRNWVITYVNPAAESLLGRGAGVMLGRHALDAVPGVKGTRLEQAFARVFADDRARVFEYL